MNSKLLPHVAAMMHAAVAVPAAAQSFGDTLTRTVQRAVEGAGQKGEAADRIYMGCVLPAGLGQAPARQAAR